MLHSNVSVGRMLCAIGVACMALPAIAGTILVPQQKATIQAGIDAAVNGDTVLVAPGTYSGPGNHDISLQGKAITVKSSGGAAVTTINAFDPQGNPHNGFMFQTNETALSVVDGFTITGGFMFNGGAVFFAWNSGGTVRNCIITGNEVACWGGGVYSESNAGPRVINCRITNNYAPEGGGVFVISSNLRVENCLIDGNTGSTGGGFCSFGGSDSLLVNCQLTNNHATGYGGGAFLYDATMINCTVANNSTEWMAAGIYGGNGGTVTNSIIWGNTGAAQIEQAAEVSYSIVEGGAVGTGNLPSNPKFMNALAGDFRLSHLSPGVDAGLNSAVPMGILKDLAGRPRFFDVLTAPNFIEQAGAPVDIGAFETGMLIIDPRLQDRR
ncbi:MAG: right-handed parallel beta-helix repeat-containing protein [Phycisphaerales bacterium]|nr:right-handed parallel beta-helix repeat-containing protein [Phycisphaerales bacterium]